MTRPRHIRFLLFATIVWCHGRAAETGARAGDRGESRVVLRVSHQLLDALAPSTLEQSYKIDATSKSTRIHGVGKASGAVGVRLQPADTGAVLIVEIRGETTNHFVGHQDPLKFYAHSGGPFRTTTRVMFDGRQFHQSKATSWSDQRTTIHRLCSRQQGLVGRVVRRIGWSKVRAARSKMNRSIGQRVQQDAAAAMDHAIEELVQELNKLMTKEIAAALHELDPSSETWRAHLSATDRYLQAAIGPLAEQVPKLGAETQTAMQSDIEIWLRRSAQDAVLTGLESIWDNSHHLLKHMLPAEDARLLPADVEIRAVGGWTVLGIGRKI